MILQVAQPSQTPPMPAHTHNAKLRTQVRTHHLLLPPQHNITPTTKVLPPLPLQSRTLLRPPRPPHMLLNPPPNPLHQLPIPPPPLLAPRPLVHLHARDPSSPRLDILRLVFTAIPDEEARVVRKQLDRIRILVPLELPALPRGEHGHHARPVVRLEHGGAVDEDEAEGDAGVDGGEGARHLEEVGGCV